LRVRLLRPLLSRAPKPIGQPTRSVRQVARPT